ncbi:CIR protein [Plasmodium chabaudi adami]|uniref:CIR protein n=1 Tax=Plasmodium chabaudi adami TaxID=5826 RepID=A0A1C6WC31_PLACE|nr:CIR protein [Plasmodium chabaudi adami]
MNYTKACKLFYDLDELFGNNSVDVKHFNELSSLYGEYCPEKDGSKRCDTDYERISAVAGYLFMDFIETNNININSDNDYNVQYFIMWISNKLYEIATNNYESLNQSYENNLDKSIGNFDFLNRRDNTKELKDGNITIMNIFYLLFKEICEAIWMDKGKKTDMYKHTNKITQCFIIYTELYKFVNPCSPYLELLEHLKTVYDEYREIAIEKKIHGQHTSGLLREFPKIDNAAKKFNFKSTECKKVHEKLIKNAQRLAKEEREKKKEREKKEKRDYYEEDEEEEDQDDDELGAIVKLLTFGDDDNEETRNVKSQDKKLEKRNKSEDSQIKPHSPGKSNKSITVTQAQPSRNEPHNTNPQSGKNSTPVTPGKLESAKPAPVKPATTKPATTKPASAKPAATKPSPAKPSPAKPAAPPKAQPKPETRQKTQQTQLPSPSLPSTGYVTSKPPNENTSNETSETGLTGTNSSTSTKTPTEHPPSPSEKPSTGQKKAASLKRAESEESPQTQKETNVPPAQTKRQPSSRPSTSEASPQPPPAKPAPAQTRTVKPAPEKSPKNPPSTVSGASTIISEGIKVSMNTTPSTNTNQTPVQPKSKILSSATSGTISTTSSSLNLSPSVTTSASSKTSTSVTTSASSKTSTSVTTSASSKTSTSVTTSTSSKISTPTEASHVKSQQISNTISPDTTSSTPIKSELEKSTPRQLAPAKPEEPPQAQPLKASLKALVSTIPGIGTASSTSATLSADATVSTGEKAGTTILPIKTALSEQNDTQQILYRTRRSPDPESLTNIPTPGSGNTGGQSSSQHITAENSGISSKKDTQPQMSQVNSSLLNHQPQGANGKEKNQSLKLNDQGNQPENAPSMPNNGSSASLDIHNKVRTTQNNTNIGINNLKNPTNDPNSQQKNLGTKQGPQNTVSENQGIESNISEGGINTDNQSQKVSPETKSTITSLTTSVTAPSSLPPSQSSSAIPSDTTSNTQEASPKIVLQPQPSITLPSSAPGTTKTAPITTTVSGGEKVKSDMASIENTLHSQDDITKRSSRAKRSLPPVISISTPTNGSGATPDTSPSSTQLITSQTNPTPPQDALQRTNRTDIKVDEKTSIWCISSNKKCNIIGIGIIGISIFAFIAFMFKYLSFGSRKKSKKKKITKKVINLVDGRKMEKTFIKSVDREKKSNIIINSGDNKKIAKIIMNSDDTNKPIKMAINPWDEKQKTHITINSDDNIKPIKKVIDPWDEKRKTHITINSDDNKKIEKIIMNSDDTNKPIKTAINPWDEKRMTHITINSEHTKKYTKSVINSGDRKKTKIIVNSVNEKITLLNIYKLMKADPMPFINLFFLVIFFVYKRKRNTIE